MVFDVSSVDAIPVSVPYLTDGVAHQRRLLVKRGTAFRALAVQDGIASSAYSGEKRMYTCQVCPTTLRTARGKDIDINAELVWLRLQNIGFRFERAKPRPHIIYGLIWDWDWEIHANYFTFDSTGRFEATSTI